MQKREQHIIKGQVQGVGFRPFVYKIAQKNSLTGFVQNTPKGVCIEIQGEESNILQFNKDFHEKLPPLARILSHEKTEIPLQNHTVKDNSSAPAFEIILSEQGEHEGHNVLVSPDVAVCQDCKKDMFDPQNRRYGYAFTNCTSCGPRYTITKSIPYDRPVTTMGCFPLCSECQQEYTNPLDRRFHAQPNACQTCGPHIWLSDGKNIDSIPNNPAYLPQKQHILAQNTEALIKCIELLNQGKIIAIKGLGGFQLACDAFNSEAITKLRQRKKRPHKAFAIMVKDLKTAQKLAFINKEAEKLLNSASAPIVLCPAKKNLPNNIAPDTHRIGIMLAYTPLHLLLFSPELLQNNTKIKVPKALIMTSANQGGKPICIKNRQALQDLQGIADYYLFHDRDILIRVDDSVCLPISHAKKPYPIVPENTKIENNKTQSTTAQDLNYFINQLPEGIYFRRARGYVPSPITFPTHETYLSSVYATGAFLKNTFCLTKENEAYPSQHIGDLDNLETMDFFDETANHLQKLLEIKPQKVLTDLHPDFPSTQVAEEYSQHHNIPLEKVQHHIAHAYAVLAEQKELENTPYLALILDGTGLGYDKTIWGGEIFYLLAKEKRHYRLASLSSIALIGGDKANFEPWRITFAYHQKAQEKGYLTIQDQLPFETNPNYSTLLAQCKLMLEKNINCPISSGCGRLFDAISAMLNICTHTSYEGQAAIKLEEYAFSSNTTEFIDIPLHKNNKIKNKIQNALNEKCTLDIYTPYIEIDTVYLYAELYKLYQRKIPITAIAKIFHNSLAHALCKCINKLQTEFPSKNLILGGGVFNNEILLRMLHDNINNQLYSNNNNILHILFPQNIPTGDACISLGQAFYGALQNNS